jgi:sigma-E factor negative regulatory protein RseA
MIQTQPIEEQLSAFMDGELGRDETRFLLKRVDADAGMVVRWSRYHIARHSLRRQETVALRADFASSLMARLDAEAMPQNNRNVLLRWGSGGAIAAAVAVAALMVTKPAQEPESVAPSMAANTSTLPSRPTPVPAQVASTNPTFQTPLVPNSPIPTAAASFGTDLSEPVAFDPRLQSYVIRHYQATGTTAQSDFVPYVLLAQPAQAQESRQSENR